jgi:hypothetical protein
MEMSQKMMDEGERDYREAGRCFEALDTHKFKTRLLYVALIKQQIYIDV